MPLDKYHAHATMLTLREELNADLAHRTKYAPDEHNLCFAYCEFNVGQPTIVVSYSDQSSLSDKVVSKFDFVPNVRAFLQHSTQQMGCNGMGQYHTEPKLLNYILARPGWNGHLTALTLVSEIDCCTTCVSYAVNRFRTHYPQVTFRVIELHKKVGEPTVSDLPELQ